MLFSNSPLVGYGAGAFEYAYRKYFDGNSYTGVAHSLLIKTIVELGILGLLCLLVLSFRGLYQDKKLYPGPLGQVCLVAAASGFLFGLVDFSFDVPPMSLPSSFYGLFLLPEMCPVTRIAIPSKERHASLVAFLPLLSFS